MGCGSCRPEVKTIFDNEVALTLGLKELKKNSDGLGCKELLDKHRILDVALVA